MVKYFCDRCGAEVEKRTFATVSVPTFFRYMNFNGKQCVSVNDYDKCVEKMLCTDCIDALQIFLEGENNGTNAV